MSDKNLRDRVPDTVPEDVELFERGGDVYGRDEHGEFKLDPMRGTAEPQDGRCGVPVKYYEERYGEIRYCGGLPVGHFNDPNYEHDEYCKHHQVHHSLMKRAEELFQHGYFSTNYINFAKKLSPAKFLFAVEMVGGLFELSDHDFDIVYESRTIDASESSVIFEDAVNVALPIPQNEMLSVQANELWTAALKEVMQQNMQEVVFEEGMQTKTLADSADMEGQITDTLYEYDEHNLHLPLSRIAKDIKEHLKNGGVDLDDDESAAVTFQQNDYTLDVSPEETDTDDAEAASDVSEDFAKQLSSEGEEIEIE